MNTSLRPKKNYMNIISIILGKNSSNKSLENQKMIMDGNGNISLNLSNPEVLRSIENQMRKIKEIPLSKDIKQAAQS